MDKDQGGQGSGLLKNDRTLLGGLFGFYLLCICTVLGFLGWWLARREITASANATATSAGFATQQADITATAAVRATEQSQYEFVERFDQVSARWFVGVSDRYYGDILYSIRDGAYVWDVRKAKEFSFSADFFKGNKIKNFDAYLDVRFVESESTGSVCAGLIFRKSPGDWNSGAFVYSLCSDSHFKLQYYDRGGWKWLTNSDYMPVFREDDWNRVEIGARGNRFDFTLNNEKVFTITDERLPEGGLGIYLEVPDGESAEVWFDNFGFQPR